MTEWKTTENLLIREWARESETERGEREGERGERGEREGRERGERERERERRERERGKWRGEKVKPEHRLTIRLYKWNTTKVWEVFRVLTAVITVRSRIQRQRDVVQFFRRTVPRLSCKPVLLVVDQQRRQRLFVVFEINVQPLFTVRFLDKRIQSIVGRQTAA